MTAGMKSSEFIFGLIGPQVMTVLNAVMGWEIDPQVLMAMFGGGGAYAMGRGFAKQAFKK